VHVVGDVHADDGRSLTYRGSSMAGILPRSEMEAVLLDEFERTSAKRCGGWMRVSVFVASFVLTLAVGWHFYFEPTAASVDLPAPVQAEVEV